VLGLIAAFLIFRKVKEFEAAFGSSNQTYRELHTEILAKNKTMRIINTILIVNFMAALMLWQAGKLLESYVNVSGMAHEAESFVSTE